MFKKLLLKKNLGDDLIQTKIDSRLNKKITKQDRFTPSLKRPKQDRFIICFICTVIRYRKKAKYLKHLNNMYDRLEYRD